MGSEIELPFGGKAYCYKQLVEAETGQVVGITLEGREIFGELSFLHPHRESRGYSLDSGGKYLAIRPSMSGGKEQIDKLLIDTEKEGFDLLEAALLRESQLYKQANRIIGGSQTQRRQAGVKSMQAGQGVGDALADGLETTLSPTSALLRLATNALRRGSMSKEIQASMAKKLMSSDPDDVASVVKALQKLEVKNTRKVVNLDTNEVLAVSGSAMPPAALIPTLLPVIS